MDNYGKQRFDPKHGPMPQPSYYPPPYPYYPPMYFQPYELPSETVNELLPKVPFTYRPSSYKTAIGLIIAGVVLCVIASIFWINIGIYSVFPLVIITLFMTIVILGIISVILLLIPKRLGWYLGVLTAVFGLVGFGIGTLIAIFALVALFSYPTRFYFKTGQVMPTMPMMPYPYYPPPGL
jgi:hypothetical protein